MHAISHFSLLVDREVFPLSKHPRLERRFSNKLKNYSLRFKGRLLQFIAPMTTNYVMPFERFMQYVDMQEADRIETSIANHIRSAQQQSPQSIDAKAISKFAKFLSDLIAPTNVSNSEKAFYKRTAERMVRASRWPMDVLDQFD